MAGRAGAVDVRRVERFTGRSAAGLIVVLALGVVFGVLSLLVRFEWTPLNRADAAATAELNAVVADRRWLVGVLDVITGFGAGMFLTWIVTITAVALVVRRRPRPAVFLVVAGLGGAALSPSLKIIVGRLRPVVDRPVAFADGNSFPSGHALGATVTYGALLLVFLPVFRRRLRPWVTALVATVIVLIGLTRPALGVHYVSDVVAGWLLGVAWLAVAATAFRLWRRDTGRPERPLRDGVEPEAAHDVDPAPHERHVLPHRWLTVAQIVTGWVVIFGALFAIGRLLTTHAEGDGVLTGVDEAIPQWFADRRTPALDELSYWLSKVGDTHTILAVSLVFCPLALAVLRRWRPVVFVALVMIGEVTLFLAGSQAVGRSRPDVPQLDGSLPTSSFPSGHCAATLCVWTAIALVVFPRTQRWWRWLPVVAAVVLPAVVALSRLYRGMHHPSDVLGALLMCALWVGLLWWVLRPAAADGPEPARRPGSGHTADDGVDDHAVPAQRATSGRRTTDGTTDGGGTTGGPSDDGTTGGPSDDGTTGRRRTADREAVPAGARTATGRRD